MTWTSFLAGQRPDYPSHLRPPEKLAFLTFVIGGGGGSSWLSFFIASLFPSCTYIYSEHSLCNLHRESLKISRNVI